MVVHQPHRHEWGVLRLLSIEFGQGCVRARVWDAPFYLYLVISSLCFPVVAGEVALIGVLFPTLPFRKRF